MGITLTGCGGGMQQTENGFIRYRIDVDVFCTVGSTRDSKDKLMESLDRENPNRNRQTPQGHR